MPFPVLAAIAAASLLLSGCRAESVGPSSAARHAIADGLQLTVALASPELRVGQSDTIRMTLRNTSGSDIRLEFSSGCQLLPYVATAGGAVMVPEAGGWMCTGALTTLLVPAKGAVTQGYPVRGGAPAPAIHTGAMLPVGEYLVEARFQASGVALRSAAVSLRVIP